MSNPHVLPDLPYAMDALEPHISEKTLSFHYGKHHAAYVNKLNAAIDGTEHAGKSLEELIMTSEGGIFNNAAQTWNHTFYWQCLSPEETDPAGTPLMQQIEKDFNDFEQFKSKFIDAAAGLFGSGWTWLVVNKQGALEIVNTGNADNPMRQGLTPVLVCDVWEHAYYLDYQNVRPDYLQAFWKIVNWNFVAEQFQEARNLQDSVA